MSGILGIYTKEPCDVASSVYYGLFALQHRGQESCGIVVNDDGVFNTFRDNGLVNDVFSHERLSSLGMGRMALGHVRYGSEGRNNRTYAQPLVINHIKGNMAVAHDGKLTNSQELREELELCGSIFHTTSDAEVISYIITKERLSTTSIEDAINNAMKKFKGAYSLCIMSPSKIIAARDPHGLHSLCYGTREDGTYIVASESCALNAMGASFVRDIEPGEIIILDKTGVRSITDHCGTAKKAMCVFEYVYFARPDSVSDGCSVHEARARAGAFLAQENKVDADIVIGVPDSGLDAAIGYSRESGIPYGIGFLKNKYIGRTFIAPGQAAREDKVRIKLNVISSVVKGKRVVMIDDSIVRGTTCKKIVKLLRDAGASEVHVRVTAPPFIAPCHYGTDIDAKDALIACKYSHDEICEIIGADSLGFLTMEHVLHIAQGEKCTGFCVGCFNEQYPTEVPKEKYKNKFQEKISDKK